jgi:hypothetical protein
MTRSHRVRVIPFSFSHCGTLARQVGGQELTLESCVGKHSTSTRVIVMPKELSMKTTVLGLAASLMLAAPVLAQTTTPPAPTPPPAASPSGQPIWYSHQADEMRASKLIGTKIVNTANETIGDINEIVIGKDGKVAAVIRRRRRFPRCWRARSRDGLRVHPYGPRLEQQPCPYGEHQQRRAQERS